MTTIRKAREQTGVEARKAIQMARYWADQGDAPKAEEWARRASVEATAFYALVGSEFSDA